MRRDILMVALLWIAITGAGLAVILSFDPFPVAASEEATISDDAFTALTIMALPVFAFIVAFLIYSVARFRRAGEPTTDGPPIRTHGPFVGAWLFITTALTIAVIIFPGVVGLQELRANDREDVDLLVQVEGGRWFWKVTYPEQRVFSREELVLPIGAHTRFETSVAASGDRVLHSFWVPAFRIKIDMVPGIVTTTATTPTELGDFEMDANFRLQCAELCGLGHALMQIPVRVVEQAEFDTWVSQQPQVR